jgi:imidazolonepropionase-like amidohydrolase
MKKHLHIAAGLSLVAAASALLYLTNTGMLTLRKPYIEKVSQEIAVWNDVLAIINVNVVPMDSERILENQTVIVRAGKIDKIGNFEDVEIPAGAEVIQAEGHYLAPGLVDMHVHIKDINEVLLFVANGVTSVRDMWGTTGAQIGMGFPDQLEIQGRIARGELIGPTIYASGPIMEGDPATMPLMPIIRTAAEAHRSIIWQKEQGYQFVKVYDNLTVDAYQAVMASAREQELPVIGHTPWRVGLEAVLQSGQHTIEHLSGYIDPDSATFIIPEDQLDHYAGLTREAGVWNTPTIGLYQKIGPQIDLDELESLPGMEYVSPRMRFLWRLFAREMSKSVTYEGVDYTGRIDEIYKEMTRALHENGAGILLGTDTDNPYLVPGFSLHEELGHLIRAGLSPYEALAAGTRSAAEALGNHDEFGTIEEGKRADLLLLEANPLDDVANADRRVGVVLRGRWLPESELQVMLAGLKDSYIPSWIDSLWPAGLLLLGFLISTGKLSKRKI